MFDSCSKTLGCVLLVLCLGVGCQNKPTEEVPKTPVGTESSTVPLQVWVIGSVSDLPMFERQWLSGSDQPIAIQSMSVETFLEKKSCDCDVVLYPSRLLGELLERKWIVKLPKSVALNKEQTDAAEQLPKSWMDQVSYDGEKWGVPMGTSTYVTIVNAAFTAAMENPRDWTEALATLGASSQPKVQFPEDVRRDLLVDRFLAIVGALATRPSEYGILFELQRMAPRLTEADCLQAARFLAVLQSQTSEIDVACAPNEVVWKWAHAQEKPAMAVIAPGLLANDVSAPNHCRAIRLPASAIGWNSGAGLVASLSANCRQSGRAALLVDWLGKSETRKNLAPIVAGIQASATTGGRDSSLSQSLNLAAEMTSTKYSSELRLARTEEYREALADALVNILNGGDAKTALEQTAKRWNEITTARGRDTQRADYERSLGLMR